ncbi:hypothetical protein CALVIDRAFT_33461 [Calocera viscosa TUFC12733]|uniref:Uncharacterized protein n=1 Tax=Calocera viscosa (strain TUFC12733) TaxID=1330018 RepID=A0A167FQK5_CALVF|nr:hypothetical protein CALVIDRAFT_33461 [Calocera viscosa TUFC12733]
MRPPGRSPNKRQRRQADAQNVTSDPVTEWAAQKEPGDNAPDNVYAFHCYRFLSYLSCRLNSDVRTLRNVIPSATATSEPPPTYKTTVSSNSPAGKVRRGLAVPKYRPAASLPDPNWPPTRTAREPVDIQIPSSPPTPRQRSQAPEPPTPHSPPVARSTPRSAALASPVQLRTPVPGFSPAAVSVNQSNGEVDSELLEVEAELGSGSGLEQASQTSVPAQDDAARAASTESSQQTLDAPTPEPGVQELLEQAQAWQLDSDGLGRPYRARASQPLPQVRQLDFSELPADQTRYPGDPRRASAAAVPGRPRPSGGRTSINDVMQRAVQERQEMVEDLRAAHGFYFDVTTVTDVLQENGDVYTAADIVLGEMRRAADQSRSRHSLSRIDMGSNDFRPAPGTKAAVVRRVQDEVEDEVFEVPRSVRRTRATVAAGLVRA